MSRLNSDARFLSDFKRSLVCLRRSCLEDCNWFLGTVGLTFNWISFKNWVQWMIYSILYLAVILIFTGIYSLELGLSASARTSYGNEPFSLIKAMKCKSSKFPLKVINRDDRTLRRGKNIFIGVVLNETKYVQTFFYYLNLTRGFAMYIYASTVARNVYVQHVRCLNSLRTVRIKMPVKTRSDIIQFIRD